MANLILHKYNFSISCEMGSQKLESSVNKSEKIYIYKVENQVAANFEKHFVKYLQKISGCKFFSHIFRSG